MKAAYFGWSSTNNIEGDKYLLNLMLFNASLQVDASQYAEKEKKKSIFAQVIRIYYSWHKIARFFVTHGKADFLDDLTIMEWSFARRERFAGLTPNCLAPEVVWDEVHAQRKSINQ